MTRANGGEWLPSRAIERSRQIENGAAQFLAVLDEQRRGDVSGTAVRIAESRLRLALKPYSEWAPVPGLEMLPGAAGVNRAWWDLAR
jgi:hypothetical protein